MLAGAMLVKPHPSTVGRIFAAVVCALGAFREGMFMSHDGLTSLTSGVWIGVGLFLSYIAILAIIAVNQFKERAPVSVNEIGK